MISGAPAENPKATEDPYKTLFVSRINYETSESKLRREFERYGKIAKVGHEMDGILGNMEYGISDCDAPRQEW